MRISLTAAVLFLALCAQSPASEPDKAARDFWKVFVQRDITKLQEQYAEQVVLKAGSEFLKKEYGINDSGDRDKDTTVKKADLMKAYSSMLMKITPEKWAKVFGAIPDDKITTKILANKHVVLVVNTGDADNPLEYELAPSKDGTRWLVVAEKTDY